MSPQRDTLVFLPAWNEEANLPTVLDELRRELPDVDAVSYTHLTLPTN